MILAQQDGGAAFIGFLVIIGLYLIPSLIAAARKVPNAGSVFVINLFLGWTLIGWVVALAMASRSAPLPPVQQHIYSPPATPRDPSSKEQGHTGVFCTRCGTEATPGNKFCGACGAPLPAA